MKNISLFLFVLFCFVACGSVETKSDDGSSNQKQSGFSITLEKVDGGTFSFEEIRGKKHLVAAFWATWCEPCKQ